MATYEIGGYKWWWDNYLHENISLILDKAIPNNWDAIGIVFGKEGSGKSTLGSQLTMFCNHKFNLDFCVFTPEEFLSVTDNCPNESSILWDEAITGATAQQQGNEISQAVISRLTTIRRKRLKIILCFPYLHMLNKYFISRCLFSIYVYAKGFSDRGYMNFYNQKKTEVLYELMKNKYTYNPMGALKKARPSFYCKYPATLCMPEKEYQAKKELSTKSRTGKPGKREQKYKAITVKLVQLIIKKKIMNKTQLIDYMGISNKTLYNILE
jgi:hypothetical protein